MNNTDNAWNVNFNNGNVNNNNKSNNNYVRAVSSGKCEFFSFASIYRAYLDCRKRKRGTANALQFEMDLLENLFDLTLAIQKGMYQPSRSVCFVTTRPKCREIFAADFRDRVVHHLLVRQLEKIWEPWFIYDSYASRKDRGLHMAVDRLSKFMNRATRSGKKSAWFLQLDIRSFFMSIDKAILFELLKVGIEKSGHPDGYAMLYLLECTVFHDCTKNYHFKGDPEMLERMPDHKSLFKVDKQKGLPIGNLTSQFFANVYLNELDQFVKHSLRCRYYLRYVDDLILVDENPDQLARWREKIAGFCRQRLLLELKPDRGPVPVSNGADFLGYIISPHYRLVRNRVVGNLNTRLSEYKRLLVKTTEYPGCVLTIYSMDFNLVQPLFQMLCSYLGHFKHANSYRLVSRLLERESWLKEYFFLENRRFYMKYDHGRIFKTIRAQHAYFKGRLGDALLFVKIGRFFELYGDDAVFAASALGLKIIEKQRSKIGSAAGFPVGKLKQYTRRALAAKKDFAVVGESHDPVRFVKKRKIENIYRIQAGGLADAA